MSHEVKSPNCMRCGRISKYLNEENLCIHCETGHGGKVKSAKVHKSLQFSHLSNRDRKGIDTFK